MQLARVVTVNVILKTFFACFQRLLQSRRSAAEIAFCNQSNDRPFDDFEYGEAGNTTAAALSA